MTTRQGPEPDLQGDTRADTFSWTNTSEVRMPGLTILGHPDPERIGEVAPLPGITAGREEPLSRREPAFTAPWGKNLQALADPWISRKPLFFGPGREEGGVRLDARDTSTRVTLGGERVEVRELTRDEVERGVVLVLAKRVVLLLHPQEPFLSHDLPRFGLIGDSAAMVRLRQEIARVADLNVPVLLRGETGTGKDLVARAIHRAGPRRQGPFVAINMGAIPPALAAAELFGAEKGAYTGADRSREGYFRQADGGVLFLDEVGETPPEVQVLLLRALDRQEIQPVGGARRRRLDVRLVAATDANLEAAVADERFRAPLLHRLSGYEIHLPPLRRRRDDVGRLVIHFLRQELDALGETWRLQPPAGDARPWLGAALVARLAELDWPGNVRQLANVVRQLVISSRGETVLRTGPQLERLLEGTAVEPPPSPATPVPPSVDQRRTPAAITEDRLREALRHQRYDLKATAAELAISRTSLYALLRRFSIAKAGDLSRAEIAACQERHGDDLAAMAGELEVSERGLLRRMKRLGLR